MSAGAVSVARGIPAQEARLMTDQGKGGARPVAGFRFPWLPGDSRRCTGAGARPPGSGHTTWCPAFQFCSSREMA
jgi:hypothetical protein